MLAIVVINRSPLVEGEEDEEEEDEEEEEEKKRTREDPGRR